MEKKECDKRNKRTISEIHLFINIITLARRRLVKDRKYINNSMLPQKLTGPQLVNKFLAICETPRFTVALTSLRHLSLSWTRPIQSTHFHFTSWRSIWILSSHLRLGLPSCLFPSYLPTQTLHTPLLFPIRATCPTHLILLSPKLYLKRTDNKPLSLCSRVHSPLPRPSCTQIFLSTLLLNILKLCSPPPMWQTKFHTHTKKMVKL